MTRVALVGSGYWGPNLARVLNQSPKCDFVAVCDSNLRNLEKSMRQYPSLKGFASFDELLMSDIDAVVIATPISTHYNLAKQALMSDKHVFVEKPLAHASGYGR